MRLISEIESYDFDIIYIPGKENIEADTLSRLIKESNSERFQVSDHHFDEIPSNFDTAYRSPGGSNSAVDSLLEQLKIWTTERQYVPLPGVVTRILLREKLVELAEHNFNAWKINSHLSRNELKLQRTDDELEFALLPISLYLTKSRAFIYISWG